MAGIVSSIVLLVAAVISSAQEEKEVKRKDRAYDLTHSMQDISERVRDKYETAKGLLPQDDADFITWTKAVSEKSIQTMKEAMKGFENVAFPAISVSSKVNIHELFFYRFLVRKLELQVQGVLTCIKDALPAVSRLKIALSTYDDLLKSGTISESQAGQAKQKVLAQHPSVEIQIPIVPSNQTIFEELHQRDIQTMAYMDEDPSLEDTEKWLATI